MDKLGTGQPKQAENTVEGGGRMPGGDGRGPEGKGPKTGRRAGNCVGNDEPNSSGLFTLRGVGRRAQRGTGRRVGRNQGRGFRWIRNIAETRDLED